MLKRFAPKPSFVARAIRTGLRHLSCALTHIVTVESVIPLAIFASVLPVQGETIRQSKLPPVTVSSAALMLVIGTLPVISETEDISDAAVPNRVSVLSTASDKAGVISFPSESRFSVSSEYLCVQNEPQIAYNSFKALSPFRARSE